MSELIIRPTAKFLKAGAAVAGLIFIGLEVLILMSWTGTPLLLFAPLVILLWPAFRALERQFTRATITGDRLRYESGVTSKTTRTIQLTKVQDVRVDQGMMQRLFNIGNLSIETAGETSRLSIPNVDDAQGLADEILNRAHRGTAAL